MKIAKIPDRNIIYSIKIKYLDYRGLEMETDARGTLLAVREEFRQLARIGAQIIHVHIEPTRG
jgi:hypothetical protein